MLVLHLFVSNVLQRNFLIILFNIASSYSIIVEFCHIGLISVACCPVGYDGKISFIHSFILLVSDRASGYLQYIFGVFERL